MAVFVSLNFNFAAKCFYEANVRFISRDEIKVAIRAALRAKRNVDVKSGHLVGVVINGGKGSVSNKRSGSNKGSRQKSPAY